MSNNYHSYSCAVCNCLSRCQLTICLILQSNSMSLREVGAAVSVLLGFVPSDGLSAASSLKVIWNNMLCRLKFYSLYYCLWELLILINVVVVVSFTVE